MSAPADPPPPYTAPSTGGINEDASLARVLRESQQLENERQRRLEQEQADLELAIQLSKQEAMTSSEA